MCNRLAGGIKIICRIEMIGAALTGFLALFFLVAWLTVEGFRDFRPYAVDDWTDLLRNMTASMDPVDKWFLDNYTHDKIIRRMMVVVILLTLSVISVIFAVALRQWVAKRNTFGLKIWISQRIGCVFLDVAIFGVIIMYSHPLRSLVVFLCIIYNVLAIGTVWSFRKELIEEEWQASGIEGGVEKYERGDEEDGSTMGKIWESNPSYTAIES